ncbi:uncharacterized protein LOC132168536 [Corylus avellana]|uniref:uncharacterized protein LOC132168536 n=1 Tax=Corylus avellana TaxID=13451 RepID=UPI00286A9ACC|nr:uncharacterized protein LOC132168536 [Corylus avellana]
MIMRRPKPFSVGYSPGPQFHFQSSSYDNRSAFDFDPTNTISRDPRWGGAAPQNNFYTFGSPSIPSPTTQSLQGEFSKFDLLPIQESVEDSHQRSEHGLDCKKPFHGFSKLKEQVGRKELGLSLNSERGEAEGDGIDLNLKL